MLTQSTVFMCFKFPVERIFRWTLCVLLGCCDYADNGPSNVNAASKHDGPPDTTDEPSFVGHNRNGELKSLFCSVFLDFFDKMKYSLFTGIVSKTGSVPLTNTFQVPV